MSYVPSILFGIAAINQQNIIELFMTGRHLGRVDEPDPDTDCGELHEAEETGRELVVAGRDAA